VEVDHEENSSDSEGSDSEDEQKSSDFREPPANSEDANMAAQQQELDENKRELFNQLATLSNNRLEENSEEDYRRLPQTENKDEESMAEESKRASMVASSNDVPNTTQLEHLLARFFEIIETYCEEQSSDIWKSKLIEYWAGKRAIKVEAIKKIDNLDWTNITKPQREDEKFEF
jgi:paraquat-inducible protein B